MLIKDVFEIEQILENGDFDELVQVHRKIACKYHNRIKDFENSLWGYIEKYGFNYELLSESSIRENLQSMKYKIEGYIEEQGGDGYMAGRGMLSAFPTETIKLKKKNGEIVSEINALVEPKKIFVDDASVIIEENDVFIRNLPNGAIEYYKVIERGFYKGTGHGILDHYQTQVKKISEAEYNKFFSDVVSDVPEKRPIKVFISHSSKDLAYVKRIVELLEDINVPEDGIFCSSVPEYGIPGGKKIYEFLREQFEKYDLHIIFVLSDNYYDSVASMNEMGAAWVLHNEYTTILLPGFPYSAIKGVIDPTEIATKLDDSTEIVNARLGELKDKIEKDFNLNKMNANKWERKRNEFIKDILSM